MVRPTLPPVEDPAGRLCQRLLFQPLASRPYGRLGRRTPLCPCTRHASHAGDVLQDLAQIIAIQSEACMTRSCRMLSQRDRNVFLLRVHKGHLLDQAMPCARYPAHWLTGSSLRRPPGRPPRWGGAAPTSHVVALAPVGGVLGSVRRSSWPCRSTCCGACGQYTPAGDRWRARRQYALAGRRHRDRLRPMEVEVKAVSDSFMDLRPASRVHARVLHVHARVLGACALTEDCFAQDAVTSFATTASPRSQGQQVA